MKVFKLFVWEEKGKIVKLTVREITQASGFYSIYLYHKTVALIVTEYNAKNVTENR